MARTVRCISLSVNGMDEVSMPTLFLDSFKDGETRTIDDDAVVDQLLTSPNFEEVLPPSPPPVQASPAKSVSIASASVSAATATMAPADGGSK